jgi:hypothetical protein
MNQSEPFESDSADQPGVFSSLRTICRGGIDFSGASVFGWNAADVSTGDRSAMDVASVSTLSPRRRQCFQIIFRLAMIGTDRKIAGSPPTSPQIMTPRITAKGWSFIPLPIKRGEFK